MLREHLHGAAHRHTNRADSANPGPHSNPPRLVCDEHTFMVCSHSTMAFSSMRCMQKAQSQPCSSASRARTVSFSIWSKALRADVGRERSVVFAHRVSVTVFGSGRFLMCLTAAPVAEAVRRRTPPDPVPRSTHSAHESGFEPPRPDLRRLPS